MSQIQSKWIADSAITSAKLDSTAKQSVLESKLIGARRGVLAFSSSAASSDTVTTQVEAAAAVDVAQSDLVTGEGIYVGAVSGATDVKKVLIRQAGSDQGVDDGAGDEVYGKLTEASGVYTLSYFKGSDDLAYTFSGATSLDFYFVEVQDFFSLKEDALLYQAVSGVIDADQSGTLSGHLDGGANKHDASEVDYERADGSKKNILAASDDVESALTNLDDAIGNLLIAPLDYTPADESIVADHFTAIDGVLGIIASANSATNTFTGKNSNLDTTPSYSSSNFASGSLEAAIGALDAALGGDLSFVPTNYANPADTVQAHSQAIDTALATAGSPDFADNVFRISDEGDSSKKIAFQASGITTATVRTISMPDRDVNLDNVGEWKTESFTLAALDISNKYVDLAGVPKDASAVQVFPVGGPMQNDGVDFDMITDGSEIKRLSWNALGMDGILASSDVLRVHYEIAG